MVPTQMKGRPLALVAGGLSCGHRRLPAERNGGVGKLLDAIDEPNLAGGQAIHRPHHQYLPRIDVLLEDP